MGEVFFFKNHVEKEGGRLVPDLFDFEKARGVKARGMRLSVKIF